MDITTDFGSVIVGSSPAGRSILELVRAHFAAEGGDGKPPKI